MYVQTAITLFNRRIGADRREIFFPTCIRSASFSESLNTRHSDGVHAEAFSYKLRIPASAEIQNGRIYLPAVAFCHLSDAEAAQHWTIQNGDYVILFDTALTEPVDAAKLQELAAQSQLIAVKDYADNTRRGSEAVKHWRIGGE